MTVKNGDIGDTSIVRTGEKIALKTVENSIQYENNLYQSGIPWREGIRTVPDDHKMALRRLQNTEKRLEKSPDIASAYNENISQYLEKSKIPKN